MVDRPKHRRQDLEKILVAAEAHGWVVTKGKNYFKLKCSCGDHLRSCHLTPSDPNYGRNLLGWLRRTCWKEDE